VIRPSINVSRVITCAYTFLILQPSKKPSTSPTAHPTTASPTSSPSARPTLSPLDSCDNGICEAHESTATCLFDCSDLVLIANGIGNRGAQGTMFQIKAKRDIAVTSFDFYGSSIRRDLVEVYTRAGSYKGHELSETGWTLLFSDDVDQLGRNDLAQIGGLDTEVAIAADEVQSFFIWTENVLMYSGGNREGGLHSSNDAVEFYEGIGITSKFSGNYADEVYSPRVFSGLIR
jgi:hypothetical protein